MAFLFTRIKGCPIPKHIEISRFVNRPSFGIKKNSSTLLLLLLFFFSFACIKNYPLQDDLTSYRHRLDSVGLAHQNQEQTQLNIHTCTIQRCYYKHDRLHKHLGTGIHPNLKSCKNMSPWI